MNIDTTDAPLAILSIHSLCMKPQKCRYLINRQDWKQCRKICCQTGDKGLNRKILDFNITQIHPDKVSKSNAILERYRLAEVQTVSAGAATFYVWVSCCSYWLILATGAVIRLLPLPLLRTCCTPNEASNTC